MAIVRPSPRVSVSDRVGDDVSRALERVDTVVGIPVSDDEISPSPAAIIGARALTHALSLLKRGWAPLAAIFITRTGDGAFQFEWHEAACYAEVIIHEPDSYDFLLESKSGVVESLVDSSKVAAQTLNQFLS